MAGASLEEIETAREGDGKGVRAEAPHATAHDAASKGKTAYAGTGKGGKNQDTNANALYRKGAEIR